MSVPVFRFAPSPNGYLHLGHALSALVGFEWAQRVGGRFLLRIEDIDPTRARPEHVDAILENLAWLGLHWEEPVLRQSQHFDVYRSYAQRLEAMGLLYPCFATRGEIAAAVGPAPTELDPDGAALYPGLSKGLGDREVQDRKQRGDSYTLRLDMQRALVLAHGRHAERPLTFSEIDSSGSFERRIARPERWGDVVIVRKDVPTSYHLSVVVDDARQGVTHVTRGEDLLAATDIHRLLQRLLDLPEPLYHHHQLITAPDGRKLSKSAHDTSLNALRLDGATPRSIRQLAGFR